MGGMMPVPQPLPPVRLQLTSAVTWQVDGSRIYVYGDRVLELAVSDPEAAARLFSRLERGATRDEALASCSDQDLAITILDTLTGLNLLGRAPSGMWEGSRVERQVAWLAAHGLDADAAQSKLSGAHVAILGLGGIGSAVLQHLLAAGLCRFCLIDCDRVEAHNLNRQPIYGGDDIGRWKVEAASTYLRRLNPGAQATLSAERIDGARDLLRIAGTDRWDCLVVAADQPPGRMQTVAADYCEQSGVPVVGAACGFEYGAWGPLLTPALAGDWLALLEGDADSGHPLRHVPKPAAVMRASFGPTNAILASLLARDIIFYLAGLPAVCEGKHCTVHFPSLRVRTEPVGSAGGTGERR